MVRSDLRIAVQAQCRLGRSLRTHIRWSGFRSEKRAQFAATESFQRDTCAGDRVGLQRVVRTAQRTTPEDNL